MVSRWHPPEIPGTKVNCKFNSKFFFRFCIHLGFPGTETSRCHKLAAMLLTAFKEMGRAWTEENKKRALDEATADPEVQGAVKRQMGLKDYLNIAAVQNADAAIARFFFFTSYTFCGS